MSKEKKTKQMSIAEQAFAYHARGFSIMPVKSDKRPALSSWKLLQTSYSTDEQVLKWFAGSTPPNIGIITGKISGITVIDIDNKVSQQITDEMLTKFPETYTVQTPSGGYHLYYLYEEGFTVSANAYSQFPNVDIRGDTGYVVAPPSKTPKGTYKVIKNVPISPFPVKLFPQKKQKKSLTELTTALKGQRNDTLASFIGKLLQVSPEKDWLTEVLPAVERANKSYTPPLPDKEVLTIFNSIMKKEQQRRKDLIISPIQVDGQHVGDMKIMKNRGGVAHNNMANVVAVLEAHPYYKGTIRYNEFQQRIEYNGKTLEDSDIFKIQYFLQTEIGLTNVGKDAVFSAILHYAYKNKYDEAQDWLKSLEWDGTTRLFDWLMNATGLPNDAYHRGVATQWFMGLVRRIMEPGCIFDYMLVAVGPQGIGKTSMFRIIGGPWYKSFTGNVENKDFFLALRGAIIVDLDEGATMYRAEVIKLKAIITTTHDEFREPYGRVMKLYPRRFVFSMSTNNIEPFRDETGNRRYWPIDLPGVVNFKWLEENRDQLFAEAFFYWKNKTEGLPQVPITDAIERQEKHLPDDAWTDLVCFEVQKSAEYCEGSVNYSITVAEIFQGMFPDQSLVRLTKPYEQRIGNILRKELGLDKKRIMVEGERKNRFFISDEKIKQLQARSLKKSITPLEKLASDIVDKHLEF